MRPQPERLDPDVSRPWLRGDDEVLHAAILRGQPVGKIAIRLGRTTSAVRARAARLGITMRKRLGVRAL